MAQVAAGGNAAEAGLRRGDVLVEAGGVELTSIEEFEEIAKILGAGDQLELKVARSGRTGKVMLQHGQQPTLEDVDNATVNVQTGSGTRSQRQRPASTPNRYQDDFSFVPPADDSSGSGMQSVIERATAWFELHRRSGPRLVNCNRTTALNRRARCSKLELNSSNNRFRLCDGSWNSFVVNKA